MGGGMVQALVMMAKGLGRALDTHFKSSFDRETSDLVNALAAWVEKNDKGRP